MGSQQLAMMRVKEENIYRRAVEGVAGDELALTVAALRRRGQSVSKVG